MTVTVLLMVMGTHVSNISAIPGRMTLLYLNIIESPHVNLMNSVGQTWYVSVTMTGGIYTEDCAWNQPQTAQRMET